MPEESHERNNFDQEQVTENINQYLNNMDLEEQRHSTGTDKWHVPTNPFCGLPESFRHNVMACVAEFVGTFMFLLMAFIIEQVANSRFETINAGIKSDAVVTCCIRIRVFVNGERLLLL